MDTLPPVDSVEYDKLPYQDKLYILRLYLFDKDRYKLLVDYGKKSADFYVEQHVAYLVNSGRLGAPNPDSNVIAAVHEGYWGAYMCHYDPQFFINRGLSPLDDFRLEFERTLGINLFSFPYLRTDFVGRKILQWLSKSKSNSVATDLLFNFILIRGYAQELVNLRKRVLIGCRAKSARQLAEFRRDKLLIEQNLTPLTIEDLDVYSSWKLKDGAPKDYSLDSILSKFSDLVEFSSIYEDIDSEDLILLTRYSKLADGWWYIPIVPAELFQDTRFTIKGWDFLVPRSDKAKSCESSRT